jgi:23S rRNA pseudouridine2605 synthase
MERIQKILAAGGIASRRAAESLITEGRVRVNGRVVTELGTKADPRKDKIEVDGKRVVAEHHVYIVVHKPRGVVATMSDPEGRPTVREILSNVGARVFPIGRLDFATSGVLLATNDGEMAEGLLHPKKAVPKTYIVKVKGKMTKDDLDHWREGVHLEDGKTIPAEAKVVRFEGDKTWFELTIKEGRNQQIRRMGEATRFPVMRLARLAFAQITAEGLRPGQWRHMTRDELVQLKKQYGVPKSIPAPPDEEIAPARRTRATEPRRGNARRPAPGDRPAGERPTGPIGERFTSRDRVAGKDGHAGRARDRRPTADKPAPTTTGTAPVSREGNGPRYGGGAPGRRGYDVTEDGGGGARRGSSTSGARNEGARAGAPAADASRGRPYPALGGGRGGRTRTTGTAGGVATTRDADRVKGRRGGR